MQRMPVLFIGHGSPINAILDNDFTKSLAQLGQTLPRPKAIMVISAHWLTHDPCLLESSRPDLIYDFVGFPDACYQVVYPAPGGPAFAQAAQQAVKSRKLRLTLNWGLDHASWAVLKHLFPQADIPVFEMSLALDLPAQEHYQMGQELAALRDQEVLIIGSGNVVHNLYLADVDDMEASPFDWAVAFDQKVKDCLEHHTHEALIHYEQLDTSADLAVPTPDHYFPLLYCAAMHADEPLSIPFEGFQNKSISMRCVKIG